MANGKSPLKILGPEILGLLVIFVIILGALNYFNILSLSRLYPTLFGSLPQQNPIKFSKQSVWNCPVSRDFCSKGEKIIYNGNPAVAYKLPVGSFVYSINSVEDSLKFYVNAKDQSAPIGLYQSNIIEDSCYRVTYTMGSDSTISKFDLFPLFRKTQLAIIGKSNVDVKTPSKNLIVQIQKSKIYPKDSGKPVFIKCSVKYVKPNQFGTFLDINTDTFK